MRKLRLSQNADKKCPVDIFYDAFHLKPPNIEEVRTWLKEELKMKK